MIDELMFVDGLIPDNELQHYGIPRKSGRYPWGSGDNPYHHGASSPSGKKLAKQQNKAIRQERRKALKNRRMLSDEELTRRITRLEKEKRLKDLTAEDLYPGKRAVNEVLGSSGKRILTTIAVGAGLTLAERIIASYVGEKQSGKDIADAYKAYARPKKK